MGSSSRHKNGISGWAGQRSYYGPGAWLRWARVRRRARRGIHRLVTILNRKNTVSANACQAFDALALNLFFAITHFRFRYKRVGFTRWCCRAARRCTTLLLLPLSSALSDLPSQAAWRRTAPAQLPLPTLPLPTLSQAVLRVGAYVVGQQGDLKLSVHPDIRY